MESRFPITVMLSSLCLLTFAVMQANHFVQLLAFVVEILDFFAKLTFDWVFSAALVAIIVELCRVYIFSVSDVEVFVRLVLSIGAGRMILPYLPPVLKSICASEDVFLLIIIALALLFLASLFSERPSVVLPAQRCQVSPPSGQEERV